MFQRFLMWISVNTNWEIKIAMKCMSTCDILILYYLGLIIYNIIQNDLNTTDHSKSFEFFKTLSIFGVRLQKKECTTIERW